MYRSLEDTGPAWKSLCPTRTPKKRVVSLSTKETVWNLRDLVDCNRQLRTLRPSPPECELFPFNRQRNRGLSPQHRGGGERDSGVQGHPQLQAEAILGYRRPCPSPDIISNLDEQRRSAIKGFRSTQKTQGSIPTNTKQFFKQGKERQREKWGAYRTQSPKDCEPTVKCQGTDSQSSHKTRG